MLQTSPRATTCPTAGDPPAGDGRSGDDPPELLDLFTSYRQTGDRRLRDQLVARHRSIAEAIARRYLNRGEPLDDLEQVAMLGLVKAIERFDPTRGIPFAGFAVPTITGELRRHFRDHTWAVKVRRGAKVLHLRLAPETERLHGQLGRAPTPAELAESLGRSVDEILDALDAGNAYRATSTDTPEGAAVISSTVAARSDADAFGPEDRLLLRELLAELPERERTIVGLRYFEELTQSEIADRVGISQVHVSRILRRAMSRLHSTAMERTAC